MSNPNEVARSRTVALVVAALLSGVGAASAGVTTEDRKNAFDAAAAASAKPKMPKYQVRCWQEGRLVLEENDVHFPNDLVTNGLKLRGVDRQNRPIYLADTRNATCIVRGIPGYPQPPQQP